MLKFIGRRNAKVLRSVRFNMEQFTHSTMQNMVVIHRDLSIETQIIISRYHSSGKLVFKPGFWQWNMDGHNYKDSYLIPSCGADNVKKLPLGCIQNQPEKNLPEGQGNPYQTFDFVREGYIIRVRKSTIFENKIVTISVRKH